MTRLFRILLGLQVALSIGLGAFSAHASVTRVYPVANCRPTSNLIHNSGGATNGLAGAGQTLVCPLITENDLAIEQVEVDVFDRNAASYQDVVCGLYTNTEASGTIDTDFVSDAATSGSSSNFQTLTLTGPTLGEYAYVECIIPPVVSSNVSGIVGLRVTTEVDCTADSQCGHYICDAGSCMTECTADNDCRSGRGCHHGSCVVPNCDDNADCGGFLCDQHLCNTTCTVNAQCAPGKVCSGNACVTPNCSAWYQCGLYTCVNSVCTTACTTNAQCRGIHTACESGSCVLDCGLWAPSGPEGCFEASCRRDDMCAAHAHCQDSDICVEDTPGCETEFDEPCD